MAAIDPILEELSREGATTRRVLERVPPDKLSWKPHPKSKSVGELAWHIAGIPRRIAAMVQHDDVDLTTIKAPPMPETSAEIVAGFDRQLAEAKELLSRLDDSAAARTTTMRRGDVKVFSGTRLALLRTVMLNHGYHHRGQLSVYLRLLEVPVPAIYGPSADES
ncbi:MAG TPA: DinB family protein [Thermoanaerobaculia bacterium]|nr:DinB family protein [Thermoanaerobaculia bacterium]